MSERELLFTGIGGQGVQLAAQVIARAAIAEGKEVQLFGSYGGMMRGGDTLATLVIGDTPNDVRAAGDNGAVSVAVATGHFSAEELRSAGAHTVLPDLADTDAVRAAVLG